MACITIRIRELATSNIIYAIGKAEDPAKMARLLVTEIEEAIIAVNRDLAAEKRNGAALAKGVASAEKDAEAWHEKARFAVASGREDLARAALNERENARRRAEDGRKANAASDENAAVLADVISQLEARLGDARTHHARLKQGKAEGANKAPGHHIDTLFDRLSAMEQRLEFTKAASSQAKTDTLDAELAEMARTAKVDAELAALRAKAEKSAGQKSKPKARKRAA